MPRILECQAVDYWFEGSIIARAINQAGFSGWPPARSTVVSAFVDAALDSGLSREGSLEYFDDWLRMAAGLELDLGPRLDKLRSVPIRLAEYWEENQNGLWDAFWTALPEAKSRIETWLHSPEIQSSLDAHEAE